MADERIKVTISVDISAVVDALTRAIYRLHPPCDVGEGVICGICVEPWPCPLLREFEQQRMGVEVDGDV